MRRLLTINLGGRLRANLKVDEKVNMFFEIISGNRKIISFIPVFTYEDALQLYKDLSGKELSHNMKKYIKDLLSERDRTYQSPDFVYDKD